ncbi:MAG: type protein [Actinomycetia bacterium]|nr:type protein [Actinomycetes bacterium]
MATSLRFFVPLTEEPSSNSPGAETMRAGTGHRPRPWRTRTRLGLVVTLVAVVAAGCRPVDTPFDRLVRDDLSFAAARVATTESVVPSSVYPQETDASGMWKTTPPSIWTSGFLAGLDWELYRATGSTAWRALAQVRQSGVESQDVNTADHDIGFKVFDSFGNGNRLTGNTNSASVLLTAADSLATLYDPDVGCLLSWGNPNTDFKVVIDSVMNLELLLWASKHGGPASLRTIAISHAKHLQRDHVRADGSTFHAVWYDPTTGSVLRKGTLQGNRDNSTWSRGQAWAMHGFTMLYRETGDPSFLATARSTADWYLAHVPDDMVPYWDFDFTDGSTEPRDSSAAAIAASGLLELARLEPDGQRANTYLLAADATLTSLSSHAYRSDGTSNQAILLHGTRFKKENNDYDTGLIFGDYFFVEALLRVRWFAPTVAPLTVSGVTASATDGFPATNTVDGNLATRWSATGDGQWIRYDLGSKQNVDKVGIAFDLGDQRASRFDIQTSLDGSAWTTHLGSLSSATTNALETYDIPDASARYVRIVGHGNSVDARTAITEVKIY